MNDEELKEYLNEMEEEYEDEFFEEDLIDDIDNLQIDAEFLSRIDDTKFDEEAEVWYITPEKK